jgi:hypothetical protein
VGFQVLNFTDFLTPGPKAAPVFGFPPRVICDLTTIAQIGDVVRVDRSDPRTRSWTIIELKEGRMNQVLSGILREKDNALADADIQHITDTFGEKAATQARRMARQNLRPRDPLFRNGVEALDGKPTDSSCLKSCPTPVGANSPSDFRISKQVGD